MHTNDRDFGVRREQAPRVDLAKCHLPGRGGLASAGPQQRKQGPYWFEYGRSEANKGKLWPVLEGGRGRSPQPPPGLVSGHGCGATSPVFRDPPATPIPERGPPLQPNAMAASLLAPARANENGGATPRMISTSRLLNSQAPRPKKKANPRRVLNQEYGGRGKKNFLTPRTREYGGLLRSFEALQVNAISAPTVGLEPTTTRLRAWRSTD